MFNAGGNTAAGISNWLSGGRLAVHVVADPLFVKVCKSGGIPSASPSNAAQIGGGRSASRGGLRFAFGLRAGRSGPVRGANCGHVRP
jgi:hypothetical protein